MKILNVLQITHDLKIGGLQKLVVDLCLNLDRTLFNVAVCCLREIGPFADDLKKNNIPIVKIDQIVNGKVNYLSFLEIKNVIKELKIDVIHTHNTNAFIDGGLAAILSRVPVRIHTDHARVFPDKMRDMISERIMSFFFNKIIAVSEKTKNDLIKYEKINPIRIQIIENGVSIKPINAKLVKNFDLDNSKIIIGTVGRLSKPKGYEYLIKAVPYLQRYTKNFEVHIIGDGELMPELKELIMRLNLNRYVKLIGEQKNVAEHYAKFDVFVISSVSEGLPLVLLEAMANKVPVIATRVGGIPEVIENERSGLLVEPAKPEQLADKIWHLLQNEQLANKFVKNAYEIFVNKFSIQTMITQYQDLYLKYYNIYSNAHK